MSLGDKTQAPHTRRREVHRRESRTIAENEVPIG